ncbi:AfsR/SARP family transcriptional regulator [Pseudonocardia broussonetiae]|uniref:AfsR/SARP family transcriptional regulator n=1 Tax=Pseudonocardia broussonetiae TaxID=2736640 RepID=UPI0019642B59|nr:BTAD domain-containing putative transcriptional regulator [Pseudonocardia broussonetiae]
MDVGPAKCRTVLAALALSAGSAVAVSRLVELVWGEDPPRTAEKTLQSYVVRLRKGLGAGSIVRTGAAYRLAVAPDAVDVARFQRHLDAGDVVSALAQWTGSPLAGLGEHGLAPVVDGLVERWLGAVELDLARHVEADAPAAVGPLTELTANHPFREGLWCLLMTALYRAGRQADALAAFRRARRHLVEQLGVEPGPRLRDLESLILGHDEQLGHDGQLGGAAPWGRPTGTVTFGFCEIPDSSGLWARHRKKMAVAIARLDELVRAAVARHRGHLFASGGESFEAAFHRADDAAAWAVELQLAVSGEPWPGGVEVALRIGLHTGETDERATGYFGPAVIAAARIAGAGHGGQTLVSGVTSALLDRDDLPELGTYRLGGDRAGLRLFQLGDGEHPPPRIEGGLRGNLPWRSGRLIGRDDDLDAVADALAQSPVVTLVGPGGIGKTSLAVAAALGVDPRSAVWLVELARITSSSDVSRAVADALEITETTGHTVSRSITAALRARPALIVLDNCEHVIDGAAAFAQAVAATCPGTRILATSREALGVADERLVVVASLDPAGPGAELFAERARAVSATFDRHASRAHIEEICRRVDGIPLAIELAAARITTLTPADLVDRLDHPLRLLTGGRRTGAERHRTLRATIRWSYDLLTHRQQALLAQLSIFTAAFDLGAARTVATDDDGSAGHDIDDLLGDLVERSMLTVESGPFGRRFRLLETMREYAGERLAEDGEVETIARRHATWCRTQVTCIHHLLVGPAEVDGVARLAELWPNLRAGFDWACATGDRELAEALVRPIAGEVNLRRQTEVSDWAERILGLTPSADQQQIVFWLAVAARRNLQIGDRYGFERLVRRHGEPDHALIRYLRAQLDDDGEALTGCCAEAVAWLRCSGDDYTAALTELGGASGLLSTGRFAEHDAVVSELADRYRVDGPPTLLYVALTLLGYSAFFQGEPERAHRLFDESADIDVPDRTISVNAPIDARSAFRRGDRPQAFRILRSHVDELLRTGNTDIAGNAAVEFITMMASLDRLNDAARVLEYLRTAGDFGALAARTLLAEAAGKIAVADDPAAGPVPQPGNQLDARHTLEHMRDVLDKLSAAPYA